jgi:hypothetical protein
MLHPPFGPTMWTARRSNLRPLRADRFQFLAGGMGPKAGCLRESWIMVFGTWLIAERQMQSDVEYWKKSAVPLRERQKI